MHGVKGSRVVRLVSKDISIDGETVRADYTNIFCSAGRSL